MLWRHSSRPVRSRLKPAGFILPCQPALADRPPSGPGWLHEIKFDGYRVIARKDGERVRPWARTTSDYSNTFSRIRDAVAQATPLEATCPNVSYRGPIIVATCYNALLQPVRSVIDVRGCVSEPANLNGQLVCERGGGGGYGFRRWHPDY
jgi:hypothetical protein